MISPPSRTLPLHFPAARHAVNDRLVLRQIPTLDGDSDRFLEAIDTALDESTIRFTTCVDMGSAMGPFDFVSLGLNVAL